MHIAIIGASNSISAMSHVIDKFGESYGLSKSRILEKYYEGLGSLPGSSSGAGALSDFRGVRGGVPEAGHCHHAWHDQA